MNADVSLVLELQCNGGVPIFLELEYNCNAHFRSFYDEASAESTKTIPITVDGKSHGSGDDTIIREPLVF